MPTLMYPVLAPLARLSARSLPGNVPATSSRPPTTAASVTLPEVRLALNAVSTAPVTGSSFATPRRATPLTVAKVPPTYSDVPLLARAHTSPATLGANDLITPLVGSKATRLLRVKVPPGLTPGAVLTELKLPPAYIVPPTWTNLYTAPLATLGVKLAGLALTTTPSAGAAPATIGTVATTRPSPIATSVVRSVRFPSETMAPLCPSRSGPALPDRTQASMVAVPGDSGTMRLNYAERIVTARRSGNQHFRLTFTCPPRSRQVVAVDADDHPGSCELCVTKPPATRTGRDHPGAAHRPRAGPGRRIPSVGCCRRRTAAGAYRAGGVGPPARRAAAAAGVRAPVRPARDGPPVARSGGATGPLRRS